MKYRTGSNDISVFNYGAMLNRSKHLAWRADMRRLMISLARFIEENELSSTRYLKGGELISDDVIIWDSELTELGKLVVWDALNPWFNGHDRGKDIEDMWAFKRALKRFS